MEGVDGECALMGLDILHTQLHHIVDGRGQTMRCDIIRRTGLELQWRLLKRSLLKAHMLNHLSPTLIRRQTVEPVFLAIEYANARGAVHLMPTEDKEVAVKVLHVDLEMRRALGAVDHHGNTVGMGDAHDILHRVDRTEDVAHVGNAYNLRMFVEQLLKGLQVEESVVGHRDDAQADAFPGGGELPGHDVGVMLHHRDDDLIARLHHRLGERGGHEVESLGGAAREDDFRRRAGVDEAAHRLAGSLMELGSLYAEVVDAAVHIGVGVEVLVAHGVEHTHRLLRRGGVVEINERLAVHLAGEYREVGPHLIYIVHHILYIVFFLNTATATVDVPRIRG